MEHKHVQHLVACPFLLTGRTGSTSVSSLAMQAYCFCLATSFCSCYVNLLGCLCKKLAEPVHPCQLGEALLGLEPPTSGLQDISRGLLLSN